MKKLLTKTYIAILFVAICLFANIQTANAQKMDRIERQQMKTMLKTIKGNVKNNYYDPNFKGIDLDARFDKAEERLNEVKTTGEALGVIAQVLLDFDDSHLFFLPPITNLDVEYGWRMMMVGDKCLVTTVKPKSDADKKGLKPGDQIVNLSGFRPSRKDLWKMNYYFNFVNKRGVMPLTVLKPGNEKPVQLNIKAEVEKKVRVITKDLIFKLFDQSGGLDIEKHLIIKTGGIGVWKMPTFTFAPSDVDKLMGEFKNSSSLILDLRGNGGGYVVTLERLVGYVFDKDMKIADLKGRKKMDPQEAKTQGDNSFKGKLIVLIDSDSGSAAEIFARFIQLEKRGVVIGDVSSGAVLQSERFSNDINDTIFYATSVTNADVIMSDGKSIEGVGVMPNSQLLPTAMDLANNRDPVLAEAIRLLGGKMSDEQAGNLFRYKWRKDGGVILELND